MTSAPADRDCVQKSLHLRTRFDPEPPTRYNPKINKATVTILNRSLEKDLKKRYPSAKQMGNHLKLLGRKMDKAQAVH